MDGPYTPVCREPTPPHPEIVKRLRACLVMDDICPECLHELDTGYECPHCGFDAIGESPHN